MSTSSPSSVNLSTALALVSSDKVRERSDGLALIKRIFSNARNCEALTNAGRDGDGGGGDSNGWLKVFQTLFGCAGVERAASLKASRSTAGTSASSAATTRLSLVASDIRWLIETSLKYLTKRTISSILAHLTQSIVHRGCLLECIATDYAKALRSILSYRPHLEWLEERNWRTLMSLCWGVAMGRRDLSFDRDDWDEDGEGTGGADFDPEPNDDEGVDKLEGTQNVSGKRSKPSSTSSSRKPSITQPRHRSKTVESAHSRSSDPGTNGTFTTAAIELTALIPILLTSPCAPLLPSPRFEIVEGKPINCRAGVPILRRILAFLEKHPEEVTPTKHVVAGLNILLAELELSAIDQVSLVGSKIFPHLVKLWPAKDLALRDSLLLAMRILLPFLCRTSSYTRSPSLSRPSLTLPDIHLDPEIADSLLDLIDRILKPTLNGGRRLLDLQPKTLWYVFHIDRPGEGTAEVNPFVTSVLRGGSSFETAGALAWVGFELRADVIAKLHMHTMGRGAARASGKRRKIEDPVETLCAQVITQGTPNRLVHLQTLYFLVERHWSALHQQLQVGCCSSMSELLADPSAEIQEWAFLVLNSALQQGPPTPTGPAKSPKTKLEELTQGTQFVQTQVSPSPYNSKGRSAQVIISLTPHFWEAIWTVALRKVNLVAGPVARSAAHLAHALLLSGMIERSLALSSIEGFLRDIAIQGPAKASDAVCSLVYTALGIVAQDVALMKAGLEDSVCTWLSGSGLDIADRKSGARATSPFCYSTFEIMRLVARLSGTQAPDLALEGELVLEGNPVVQRMFSENGDQELRTFLLHAQLPMNDTTRTQRRDAASPAVAITDRARQRGLLLSRAIEERVRRELEAWEDNVAIPTPSLGKHHSLHSSSQSSSATAEVPLFRSAIDLAVLAIMIEVGFVAQDVARPREGLAAACNLLGSVLAKVFKNGLKPLARAQIILGMDPLFGRYSTKSRSTGLPPIIIRPDRVLGIVSPRNDSIPDVTARAFDWDPFLIALWQETAVLETWSTLVEPLRNVFRPDKDQTGVSLIAKRTADDDDRDFHDITDATGAVGDQATSDTAACQEAAVFTCARICVRALLRPKHYQIAMSRPIRERSLLNLLIQADGNLFLSLAPPVLAAMADNSLECKGDALGLLLEEVNEFLSSYDFASSTDMRRLVIHFIGITRILWTDKDSVDADTAESIVRTLSRFCVLLDVGRIASWRVREALLVTIEEYLLTQPDAHTWTEYTSTDLLPINSVQTCLEDPDARIRSRAAIIMAKVFDSPAIMQPIADPWGFYTMTAGYFFNSNDIPAGQVQTRLLFFANVTIVSDICRRASLYHIYDMVPNWPANCPFVLSCLQGVASALRLPSIRPLYLEYAPRLTASQEEDEQDPSLLPMSLYGCRNKQEWSETALPVIDCVLLQLDNAQRWQAFHPSDGLECMQRAWPTVVAMSLAYTARAFERSDPTLKLNKVLEIALGDANKKLKKMMKLYSDDKVATIIDPCDPYFVLSALFALIDDTEDVVSMASTLNGMPNGFHLSETFRALVRTGEGDEAASILFEVNMPRAAFSHVMKVHAWIVSHCAGKLDTSKLAHHLLVELICKVDSSILKNERQRFLRSFLVAITLYETQVVEMPVLRTLLRHISMLSGQADTAREVEPLLLWILRRTKLLQADEDEVPALLASIASACCKHAAHVLDARSAESLTFITHFEGVMGRRLKDGSTRAMAVKTLLLWPRTLPHDLDAEIRRVDVDIPLSLLRDRVGDPSQFALSKEMLRRVETDPSLAKKHLFWYFRTAFAGESANWDDVQAFLQLQLQGRAPIDIPDDPILLRMRDDPRDHATPREVSDADYSLRKILYTVYDTYVRGSFTDMRAAYVALGSMLHVPQTAGLVAKTSRKVEQDLSMVQRGLTPPHRVSETDLTGLQHKSGKSAKAKDYSIWISDLIRLLAGDASQTYPMCACLGPLLRNDMTAATTMLPPLVHLVLTAALDSTESKDADEVNGRSGVLSDYFNQILDDPDAALAVKRTIIDVVLFLRSMPYKAPGSNELDSNIWLTVDYTALARAAVACRAYPTAILFYEISIDPDSCGSDHSTKLDSREVDELLHAIYTKTPEPDGFYGIPQISDTFKALMRRLKHEADWQSAFMHHGANLEAGSRNETAGLKQALHAFGYNQLAVNVSYQQGDERTESDVLSDDLAWRTGNWDLPATKGTEDGSDGGSSFYRVLRSVHRSHNDDEPKSLARSAILAELVELRNGEGENILGLRQTSLRLLRLREVESWAEDLLPLVRSSSFDSASWHGFVKITDRVSSAHAQEIMAVRISLLTSALDTEGPSLGVIKTDRTQALESLAIKCHLALSRLARLDGDTRGAINAMAKANTISGVSSMLHPADLILENSQVLWAQGEHTYAINMLKEAIGLEPSAGGVGRASCAWQATAKSILGEWIAAARQADADTIESQYFDKSVALLALGKAQMSLEEQASIHFRLARYSDEQQRALFQDNEEKSKRIQADRKRLNEEIEILSHTKPGESRKSRDARLTYRSDLLADRTRDIEDMAEYKERRHGAVVSALFNYARAISLTDDHDSAVMQLCALWMEQHANEGANNKLKPALEKVPTHKFIFLAHQLTSRLTTELPEAQKGQSIFQMSLDRLVTAIGTEHPFHIVYQILTMAYPHQPYAATSSARRVSAKGAGDNATETPTPREEAAIAIHQRLRTHASRGAIIKEMETFVMAAVQWAWHPPPGEKTGVKQLNVPAEAAIVRLRDMSIPVASANIPIDHTKAYTDIVRIAGYEKKYAIANGVHRPKIMLCLGSDGKKYRELASHRSAFKADDDLRQDSVMEQFFALVNRMLGQDKRTRERDLTFRTYNVIPLANQSGIIQFVGDTISLGEWLTPAHPRYRPGDMRASELKTEMKKVQDAECNAKELQGGKSQPSQLPKLLSKLQTRFRPVMRHFFTEGRHDPVSWYATRLRYARSVAVGSIAGHIVGLGDRHCSNILIDRSSGELVHIDLGVAFEQGKRLSIPELVPFRLTNDIVDGLGSSGVEGVFKRCCEETLRVLRDNSQLVLTVLEVFKYDPLHTWAKTDKVGRTQGESKKALTATQPNSFEYSKADRILGQVAKKLDKQMSVEYAVTDLIRMARDYNNMAVIFVGWQCWM